MNKDINIARQVAIECAITVCEKKNIQIANDDIFTVADDFVNFIMKEGTNKDILIQRNAALKRAARSTNIVFIGKQLVNGSIDVMILAEQYYNYFNK